MKINDLLYPVVCGLFLGCCVSASGEIQEKYISFQEALKLQDDSAALDAGDRLFTLLEREYRTDAGFVALKSKLTASEFDIVTHILASSVRYRV